MRDQLTGDAILSVRHLTKIYGASRGFAGDTLGVRAVEDVSFDVRRGETIGIVGESGCGKSTVARTLLRLQEPTAGEALFDGKDIFAMRPSALKHTRRRMQVIFQDPYASLNPRMTVGDSIAEPWQVHPGTLPRAARGERVGELLSSVGLRPEHAARYPHQFSGGQLQRIGIARAMALEPDVLICDEPVSALDLSVQAQVINLLQELQQKHGLAIVFIAHDLSVVRHISHRVAVMYLGRIVEIGDTAEIYERPLHPYSRALLSAEPRLDFSGARGSERILLKGDVPSPLNPPSGCRFRTRCWKATALCAAEAPPLVPLPGSAPDHRTACHFPEDVYARPASV